MEELLINDYVNNLLSTKELAKKYHMAQGTILNILRKSGIKMRTASESLFLRRNPDYTIEQIREKIIDNYVNKGYGQERSGREFGISGKTVKRILKENNIKIRDLNESICLSNQTNDRTVQHYFKNDNFFSVQSHDMAWLLGFLASDGNVGKNDNMIRIELSIVDKEILEKIKEVTKIENPIKERIDKRGFHFCSLEWSCRQHKQDLAEYGIIPCKTYILKPPFSLKEEYYIDYIRGYFDGDGTINLNHCSHGNALRWGICGASKCVLDWIVQVFNKQYQIPVVNIHKDSSHVRDFYSIVYSTNSTKKIYDILYTKNSLYLKRKKDKFQKLIKAFS